MALLFFWVIWVPRLVSVEPVFPVTITTQPRSITVPISSTGVFSVVTNGNVFQWRHNGQPIPGATSATLTIANVQSGDAGSYDVVVTGSGTITSTAAVLSIGQPIQFVVQPRDASIAVGSRAAFCIDVTGDGPFTYQWQSITVRAVTSKIDDGITYQGTTTATLVVGPAPFAGGRTQLFCEVTDIHGSPVNSRTAQLLTGNLQCLTITTLAGGSPGNTDGHGTAARFNQPSGIAADAWGNLYVADFYNNTIRKVNPTGDVTTLAGLAGSSGSADGFGSTARFYGPCGITADASGNLFVTDFYNNTIRKVSSVGVVTTVAGLAGSQGSTDGFGSTAQFYMPNGIANDSAGNLYVTDMGNSTVRKITPVGVVTTVAGLAGSRGSADGFGSAALFNNPIGISVDVVGNLYVADSGNCTIREITPAGMVTTFAGFAGSSGNADGTGNTVRFTAPSGIASDVAGDLYVIDENSVREVSTTGVVTTVAGQAGIAFGNTDGIGSVAQFYSPFGIAVDATGSVFIADNHNNLIRKGVPTTLTARLGSLSARGLAGAGDQTLIAGFATSGDGNKQLLLRGIGPSLAPFGVSSVVADPALTLFNVAGTVLQQNNDWGGTAALTSAFTQVGAFSLSPNSKDAALLTTLPGGVYTAHLTAQG
ncbi:MAG TPA: hypothetical protein VMC06_11680, partial [Opitutaceae bacterium]|nr:hypothetical protein [Opitutaceae bacterium]